MNVSSYLEAFLSVYGWDVYYVIYLTLAASGLFLYPLARSVIEIFIDAQTVGETDTLVNSLKSAIVSVALMMLVFVTTLIPTIPLKLDGMQVKTICEKADYNPYQVNKNRKETFFAITETKVPILPWIAMAIGHGTASTLFKASPCTIDVSETRKNMTNLNFDTIPNSEDLSQEYNRYMAECHRPMRDALLAINGQGYGAPMREWLRDQVDDIQNLIITSADKAIERDKKELFYAPNSPLIKRAFFENTTAGGSPVQKQLYEMSLSFRAKKPVAGFTGPNDGSPQQGADTPPLCKDWWNGQGGTEGLHKRVLTALTDNLSHKMLRELSVWECRPKSPFASSTSVNLAQCKQKIIDEVFKGDNQEFENEVFAAFTQASSSEPEGMLSTGESLALTAGAVAVIAGPILSKKIGIDISGGILETAVGFYGTMFMLKLLMKFLLPLIVMGVYMFWGVYMVIGAFRGSVIVKGMVMIWGLAIVPALWALVEHLDDQLWGDMYGFWSNPFARMLMDTAVTMFYFGIIFILFHIVNMAGGGDIGGAVKGSHHQASGLGTQFGSGVGKSVGGGIKQGTSWGSGKLKIGWNKLKGMKK